MKTVLLTLAALALPLCLAAPAYAQVDHSKMDHAKMDHGTMDHGTMDHAGHDHAAEVDPHAGHAMPGSAVTLSRTDDIDAALAAGGEAVVVKVLGAVCDFCATAMNKTFGRRDDVAAVYVDLDAKTLNLVVKPGEELTDEALRKLVKKAGYKADAIARGAAVTAS